MSSKPTQTRTVDPFAEYNSNVANRFTRMMTGNDNVLMSTNSLALALDTTSPTTVAVVQTGTVFKDDVLIEVTEDHRVDFEDLDNYISPGPGFNEIGSYYIVLEYTYVKSRPAPEAEIKILKPSQRATGYPVDSLLLLGVVKVIQPGASPVIDVSNAFSNYDSESGYEDNKREYVKFYAGTETNLPTHTKFRDQSRIAYDSETDKFWLGYENNWQEFGTGGSVINIDTTGTTVGQLCYTDASRAAVPAIATAGDTGADIAVAAVGLEVDSSGKGLTSGIANDVPVEGAVIVTAGDLLYLSATEAGKVTNVKTNPYYQVVGRALTSRVGAGPVDIIFTPKVVLSDAIVGRITATGDWSLDGGSGLYYHDIDISLLEVSAELAVLTNFFDDATDMVIQPNDIEIRTGGLEVRVWMNVNTVSINYIIATGGGGNISVGGGGGGSDHSLLANLDFAASGHTGFAAGNLAGGHGNADHSDTFITATGVTFGNLSGNGDVGTGATQVAQGNHTHAGLGGDIPSGTAMLFLQASAPVGWTIKTTGFTNNSMIVLGTSYALGGSADARTYNPNVVAAGAGAHSHSISSEANHTHTGNTNLETKTGTNVATDGGPDSHYHYFTTDPAGAHSHGGATGGEANHAHSMSYDTYDPYYARVIAATKD